MSEVKHPAKYSEPILLEIADHIHVLTRDWEDRPKQLRVHDLFGGTGRIHLLQDYWNCAIETTAREIEPEWSAMHERTLLGDSSTEDLPDGTHWVATSPCYGNRMADTLLVEGRKDYTYTGYHSGLGRELDDNNSGKMQWGEVYRDLHTKVYRKMAECPTLLAVTINIKDHVRGGNVVGVPMWHVAEIAKLGFDIRRMTTVETRGQRNGTNKGDMILKAEWVITMTRSEESLN